MGNMENRIYLKDLNRDELKQVYNNNSILSNKVSEYVTEDRMNYVIEILDYFRSSLKKWEVGYYSRSFIQVADGKAKEFLEGLIKSQNDYGFLRDEFNPTIKKLMEAIERLIKMEWWCKQAENLSAWIEKQINFLENEVEKQFDRLLEYSSVDLEEYFIECWDCFVEDGFVLDQEERDYILYQEIHYFKNYK